MSNKGFQTRTFDHRKQNNAGKVSGNPSSPLLVVLTVLIYFIIRSKTFPFTSEGPWNQKIFGQKGLCIGSKVHEKCFSSQLGQQKGSGRLKNRSFNSRLLTTSPDLIDTVIINENENPYVSSLRRTFLIRCPIKAFRHDRSIIGNKTTLERFQEILHRLCWWSEQCSSHSSSDQRPFHSHLKDLGFKSNSFEWLSLKVN
ncbi:hypothetical protein CDAR_456781 [Caerostris darwini]|uniref:Uncharacterized protein n=1 Tax=Caerostris darwini TaxID=1538125 RepID=A0AAV4TNF5_9ARAC|nr:hypothetical protein CDAR_456781 [Caerostris darwini]